MDTTILLEYASVLVVLVVLEGLLAADNAIVLAVMVRHLDSTNRKKALFYGLIGAFIFRMVAILLLVWLVQWWFVQAIGAIYLFYVSISHLIGIYKNKHNSEEQTLKKAEESPPKKESGLWMTVFKVEVADIAFAVDSILAAAAIALALPKVGVDFLGVNIGQYLVMLIGGLIGVIIMRFFANWFVQLLAERPNLEIAAFLIVGWVGVKLTVLTLSHPSVAILPETFPTMVAWKITFWAVMILIMLIGWFSESGKNKEQV